MHTTIDIGHVQNYHAGTLQYKCKDISIRGSRGYGAKGVQNGNQLYDTCSHLDVMMRLGIAVMLLITVSLKLRRPRNIDELQVLIPLSYFWATQPCGVAIIGNMIVTPLGEQWYTS